MGRFGVVTPPFTVPAAPASLALCEAAAARQGQDVLNAVLASPAATRGGIPELSSAGAGEHVLGLSPRGGAGEALGVDAPHQRARLAMALQRVGKIFDFPRASMSRRGRSHVLSLGGPRWVWETRYGARQTPHQVGRWTAPPSCGPCSAAATHLLPRTRAAARAFRCIDQQMTA